MPWLGPLVVDFVSAEDCCLEVREIYNTSMEIPTMWAEDRAVASLEFLRGHGRYWPRAQDDI